MGGDTIRYDLLAQEAMRGVIRLALERAASPEGLPGEHHFYITFVTGFEGVVLPLHLREKYPEEMTIIIKRHYWDLLVEQDGFSVSLSFSGQAENLRIPYAAVVRFLDPQAEFVLQFPREAPPPKAPSVQEAPPRRDEPKTAEAEKAEDDGAPSAAAGGAEVVRLDQFRKR